MNDFETMTGNPLGLTKTVIVVFFFVSLFVFLIAGVRKLWKEVK